MRLLKNEIRQLKFSIILRLLRYSLFYLWNVKTKSLPIKIEFKGWPRPQNNY